MRKGLCVMVSLLMALSVMQVAAAQQMTITGSYDFKTDTITVTGTIPDGRHRLVLLQVLQPEYDGTSTITAENAAELVFYTDDVVANPDGTYQFTFGLNGGATGVYTLKAATADSDGFVTAQLSCINEQDIKNMLGRINDAAKWEDVEALFEQEQAAAILGLNMQIYGTVQNRDLIYQQIYAEKTNAPFTFEGIDRLEALFDTYSALAELNETDNPERVMTEYADLLGYLEDAPGAEYTFHTLLDDEGRKLVYAAHRDGKFTSTEELKTHFAQTAVLYAVARSKWQALTTIVEKNLEILDDIDYEKYQKLDSSGDAAANIVGELYPSIDAFVTAFNDETDRQYKSEHPTSTGGGGGSGGGGGGSRGSSPSGNTVTSTIVPPTPVTEPDIPDTTSFKDLDSCQWAVEAIDYLKQNRIVAGKADGIFAPNDPVTREEFVKMMVLALGVHNPNAESTFLDVPAGHWSSSYIQSAMDAELVYGIDDTHFGLGEKISRQDMSVMVYRAMAETAGAAAEVELAFADAGDIADYAREAVAQLNQMGIINGISETEFAPRAELTRAQAAKVVYEMVK